MASSIEQLGCVVDLRYLQTLFATKWWPFAAKTLHLSRYAKTHTLLIDLSKFSKTVCHYTFFFFFFLELCE